MLRTVLLAMLVAAAPARGDEGLLLGRGHLVLDAGAALTSDAGGTGTTLVAALDVGLASRVQAGVLLAVPVAPLAGFGTLVGDLMVRVGDDLALRLDGGFGDSYATQLGNTVALGTSGIVGFGAPARVRLWRWLALASGSTTALGFAPPQLHASPATYAGIVEFGHDLVAVAVASGSDGTDWEASLALPVALVARPDAHVELSLGTAARALVTGGPDQATATRWFVPLEASLIVHPVGWLDAGATLVVPGSVDDWAGERLVEAWVGVRR